MEVVQEISGKGPASFSPHRFAGSASPPVVSAPLITSGLHRHSVAPPSLAVGVLTPDGVPVAGQNSNFMKKPRPPPIYGTASPPPTHTYTLSSKNEAGEAPLAALSPRTRGERVGVWRGAHPHLGMGRPGGAPAAPRRPGTPVGPSSSLPPAASAAGREAGAPRSEGELHHGVDARSFPPI